MSAFNDEIEVECPKCRKVFNSEKGLLEHFVKEHIDPDSEIRDVKARIRKLSAFYADGKIGEQSYLATAKTLEKKLETLMEIKNNPNVELSIISEPIEAEEFEGTSTKSVEKPETFWYVVPLLFGIIGSLIAYVAVKDEDRNMAHNLIWVGLVMTFFDVIILWILYSWL